MSRIGKLPIILPENVRLSFEDSRVVVEGPRGKIEQALNLDVELKIDGNKVFVISRGQDSNAKAFHGLVRSLVNNMVIGVSRGFSKTLKIVGIGYKAQLQGKTLVLNLGYSHPIQYPVPEGISIELPDPNTISVKGIDKQLVGQCASDIRRFRIPDPYKGKGIMYADEKLRRKAGKTGIK
ncbi:MAG: 50S ribosomal protein L6 [Spirochaetota bacterium]